jgi:hypothetical protein
MMARKKEFVIGLAMMLAFFVVLVVMFSPVFNGKNALETLDDLYNSISKGSAYYIPAVREESRAFAGQSVAVTLELASEQQASQSASLFDQAGAETTISGSQLAISGDLGAILSSCLKDADAMYANQGGQVAARYGYEERQVLYNWWRAFNAMDKALKAQKQFKAAKMVKLAVDKAMEPSYNYYRIEPQKISDKFGIVVFSLVFYVVYTLWYGFAIMFMFEGWGMRLEH